MKFLVAVAIFGAAGCSWTIGQCFRDKGIARAAFDLQCPQGQIQPSFLNHSASEQMSAAALGTQVGVKGCGKQTVYILDGDPQNPNAWQWIANREVNASK